MNAELPPSNGTQPRGQRLLLVAGLFMVLLNYPLLGAFDHNGRVPKPAQARELGRGLASLQKIVELHQGRIWVESSPEQGARFFVGLPLAEPARAAAPFPFCYEHLSQIIS